MSGTTPGAPSGVPGRTDLAAVIGLELSRHRLVGPNRDGWAMCLCEQWETLGRITDVEHAWRRHVVAHLALVIEVTR